MKVAIISNSTTLEREMWTFSLEINIGNPHIYFDSFVFQTRPSTRHKWINQSYWDRLDKRNSNIDCPNIPSEIENKMRIEFQALILDIPIKK